MRRLGGARVGGLHHHDDGPKALPVIAEEDLVFVANTTTGINSVIRSMDLFRYRDTYLVRSESEDGAIGVATANSRCKVRAWDFVIRSCFS